MVFNLGQQRTTHSKEKVQDTQKVSVKEVGLPRVRNNFSVLSTRQLVMEKS